ncbi:MAG: Crp/Fnr family transcriptional regulator [Desulforhopalus sp.]|nr:Crp/Fnr family transcriptional regulator [Desulforhopalus sp.]
MSSARFDLSTLPFLKGSESFISALQEQHFAAGEKIFDCGDAVEGLGFILSGRVGIKEQTGFEEKTQIIALLDPGAPLGEKLFTGLDTHAAGAVAVEETHIALLSVDAWVKIREEEPKLACELLEWVLERVSLRLGKASERLAHIL